MTFEYRIGEDARINIEREIRERTGGLVSAMAGIPIRHPDSPEADVESRLVALELNVERVYRGLLLIARAIDDERAARTRRLAPRDSFEC